jgi:DNA ligase-1
MTFKRLSEYFQELEKTSSRLKMTDILAHLFKESQAAEIDKIAYLSLGVLLPPYEGLEFQMAEKMMVRAIARAFGVEDTVVQKKYKEVGDLGTVAEKFKVQSSKSKVQSALWDLRDKRDTRELGVSRVYERLIEIAKETGAGSVERKIGKMAALLEGLDALSVRFVVRVPLGKLRLGFSDLTILDALSWMETGGKSLRPELEAAFNVRADIGEIAKRVKEAGVRGVKEIKPAVGTPILPALAQRLGTVEEMLEKMGTVAVEPKYDGTRLQIHLGKFEEEKGKSQPAGKQVRIFTRNLENVTAMFPDIAEAVRKEVKTKEAILDSEGVGVDPKTGRYLPFQETIKRKRKHEIEKTAKEIPLKCFVFDILFKDGKSLLSSPLLERRKILEKTLPSRPNVLVISPQVVTDDPEEMRAFHEEQIKKGLEGAMVKKANAPYEAGRRGFSWVKYKQEETKKGGGLADTVDAVIMGITRGRGKRAQFGVGSFLVGVRKGEKFVTVTNIGTGLTDEQFRELNKRSEKLKASEEPKDYEVHKNQEPDVWVKPKVVVEIQADNITKSPIHTAGLALRFPRLIRFRDDRSPKDATTVAEVEQLYRLQFEQK